MHPQNPLDPRAALNLQPGPGSFRKIKDPVRQPNSIETRPRHQAPISSNISSPGLILYEHSA
jgi:hypothetical protein